MIQRKQGNNMKCRAKFMENDGTLKKDKRKREFTYEKNLFSGLHEDILTNKLESIHTNR
jgi:hypothetical protein